MRKRRSETHVTTRLSRRTFCRSVLAAGGLSAASGCAGLSWRVGSRRRPNVLLVTADDLGTQVGCYGDPIARTPCLDRLAAEGVRFDRAFVTQTSCSPSRSSILTGLYPHQNGQVGLSHYGTYRMHDDVETLPQRLKAADYRTGVIGKIHVAPREVFPFDWVSSLKVQDTRNVAAVAEEAGAFMRADGDQPFFLMVNYLDPHRPLVNQVEGQPEAPFGPDDIEPFDFLALDTPKVREEVAGYYNCATRFDTGIGLLLKQLAAAGLDENTLVIVLGDHGPPFTRSKTTCYEAGLHIPLLVRWPGRCKAGHTTDALVSTVDLVPTILDAAGAARLPGVAGASLMPLLKGKTPRWRKTVCAEYTAHGPPHFYPRRSIRDDRFKLILNLLPDRDNPIGGVDGCAAWAASRDPALEGSAVRRAYDTYRHPPAVELYDLQQDPCELRNLAGNQVYREQERRLIRRLRAWREETNDPLLDPCVVDEMLRESRISVKPTAGAS